MLQPELLIFSRTLSNDYRWIYCSEYITQADRDVLDADYRLFDQNKAVALSEKQLYVRWLSNSIVLYSFCKSTHRDENSRPIFALVGFSFSGFDRHILAPLLHVVAASLFVNPGSRFDCDSWKITDSISNQSYPTNISIDEMVMQCKSDSKTYSLMEKILNTKIDTQGEALVIKSEEIDVLRQQPITPIKPPNAKQNCTTTTGPISPIKGSAYQAAPRRNGFVGWLGSLVSKIDHLDATQNQDNKNDEEHNNSSAGFPYK